MDNELTGKGEVKWDNGDAYVGELKQGVPHGFGLYRWAESDYVYEGNFRQGEIYGRGMLKKGGSVINGLWVHGKLKKVF